MSFYFPKQRIQVLKTSDFSTDTTNKIWIEKKNLTLVLFQDHSPQSQRSATMWENVSKKIVGVNFAACDLFEESEIAMCITNILNDNTSPYKNIFRHSFPFIVTYMGGIPQRVFTGVMSEYELTIYCSSLTNTKKPNIELEDDESELPRVV